MQCNTRRNPKPLTFAILTCKSADAFNWKWWPTKILYQENSFLNMFLEKLKELDDWTSDGDFD